MPKQLCRDGGRRSEEGTPVEPHPPVPVVGEQEGPHQGREEGIEGFFRRPGVATEAKDAFPRTWMDRLEEWHHLESEAVARPRWIEVRGVVAHRESPVGSPRLELAARDAEERPEHPSRTGRTAMEPGPPASPRDPREPAQPGASQDPEEDRLDLVVLVVRRQETSGSEGAGGAVEEVVSEGARCGLAPGRRACPFEDEGNAEFTAVRLDRPGIGGTTVAHRVIEVGGVELGPGGGGPDEEVQEHRGVEPPGEGQEEGGSWVRPTFVPPPGGEPGLEGGGDSGRAAHGREPGGRARPVSS